MKEEMQNNNDRERVQVCKVYMLQMTVSNVHSLYWKEGAFRLLLWLHEIQPDFHFELVHAFVMIKDTMMRSKQALNPPIPNSEEEFVSLLHGFKKKRKADELTQKIQWESDLCEIDASITFLTFHEMRQEAWVFDKIGGVPIWDRTES